MVAPVKPAVQTYKSTLERSIEPLPYDRTEIRLTIHTELFQWSLLRGGCYCEKNRNNTL